MTSPVSISVDGGVATVLIDNPPVNATSQAVRQGILDAIREIDANDTVQAAVLACAGRTFVAGADIREFGKPPEEPHLPDVLQAVETARVPVVAAIHGSALGGGLELALACHARIADGKAKLGLPEVTLGLVPGAGGTVRLPRLVAMENAMEMVTGGKPVSAGRALEIGLVDRISNNDLVSEARAYAEELIQSGKPEPTSARTPRDRPDASFWTEKEKRIAAKARGQQSPVEALHALRDSVTLPVADALTAERARFLRLRDTEQAAALRYMFFAERNTGRPAEIENVEPLGLGVAGVVGGGTMGAGIAAAMLLAGMTVVLTERDAAAAETARERVAGILDGSRKRGLLSDAAWKDALSRFSAQDNYNALSAADLVIEAVFEDMGVKREVFTELDRVCRADAILASNTSYLDVNELANATKDPSRVVGLHFFSPAHIMKLLEIVRTDAAAPATLATAFALAKKLRKIPVLAGVCDGFIGNRIMAAYRRECDFILEEGALPQDVDAAMRDYGFAMGIYAVQDMAGLDIAWAMRKRRAATRPADERYSRIADRLCELGRFGRKTAAGWYAYADGAKAGQPDPAVEKIILEESARLGFTRKPFTAEEIMERILASMQAEARAVLDEGIALKPSDIDVAMVHGYGFPRFRGGPMFAAGYRD
ncbi:3-hydroxyacyl-CoA dehydrogenase NAD-binding domain-containing protein [Oricola thermophila]|uniref:Enoyl-CoA hydratase/isomerase family protein n=1 Tax=Oricola thermophila TaxID=2742145 RepID=A0A6N1V964_9HYPH|nr:3-hydroxyacyl-CoA dehydrogenase NAD-binding domain-containing protein [Oricola thermophila]QKV17460.1 enoyl-CoA hydratase/isomerase family protein [Oricola thermophila]